MNRSRRSARRYTAIIVGLGAAGVAIGWRYAERGGLSDQARLLSR